MQTSIRGIQDCGKTSLMTGLILRDLAAGTRWPNGYRPDDVHVNYGIKIDGVHVHDNEGMIAFLQKAIRDKIRHKILGITEADRVFPARFWQDKGQTAALLGLWQDFGMFWTVYWDAHIGTGVDIILRDTRERAIVPSYDAKLDIIRYGMADRIKMKVYHGLIYPHVSKMIFPYYDRWEVHG